MKYLLVILLLTGYLVQAQHTSRQLFTAQWQFKLDSTGSYQLPDVNDKDWRILDLPHDWSIEGDFSESNPATPGGGALPGGVGWYRKHFKLPVTDQSKKVFIEFDGVYMNSEVWINGHYLGQRPYGYSSFQYELTPYLHTGSRENVLAVKVNNNRQPNSRWYSGSGIYRNVWLVAVNPLHVAHWGTYIYATAVSATTAQLSMNTSVVNEQTTACSFDIKTTVYDQKGHAVSRGQQRQQVAAGETVQLNQALTVDQPVLWSVENPYLYKVVTEVIQGDRLIDRYSTTTGIRSFKFDAQKGFILNGQPVKIAGVCNHHDLGCLGTAINRRALERQLELLKKMGCNGIRTSHNPPAPELLDICDSMGFIVMDEAFDMWKRSKNPYDYHLYWDSCHREDLAAMIRRDRNHPSIFMWSIGNEIMEQWPVDNDTSGRAIARELATIVRSLDTTRPVTSANNNTGTDNQLLLSGAMDIIGYNYHHDEFAKVPERYPGMPFIATETVSALQTRGYYDMPSDSIRRWPRKWDEPFIDGNTEFACSAYDNCSTPWGSTHEETWKVIKQQDFNAGMYIWTGFDYLGEPTPYPWPARSSYFGIIDLAGFPKDVYYMYQSEWTHTPVLHVFPHWNWQPGDTVDIWAYYNEADEVELYLNGKSVGVRKKTGDSLHVWWRLPFTPGTLKAVSRLNGKPVLTRTISTAGKPARIVLQPDRQHIQADGRDMSFVTVRIEDAKGNLVPDADNLVEFHLNGLGKIAGVDNGSPISHESFKVPYRKAFHGLALVVVQAGKRAGNIILEATGEGLEKATVILSSQ